MSKIDCFFNPKSVAIIGASRNPRKIGHVILRNFIDGGYKGKIYPINPNTNEILGHKCYKSVFNVNHRIDLAVIALPAPIVPKTLEQCGKKGMHAAIIVSGGFKEIGEIELEKQITKISKKYKIRVLGPNTLGVYDPYSGVDTIFNPRYKLGRPEPGHISFISQSGATMSVILDWMSMKGYKAAKFVSYGNASDVDEADLIEYLLKDKDSKVICMYFEGVKNGRKFFEATKNSNKPLIALKGGKTKEGTKAVSSHTGSLAGEAEIYSAAFKQAGVVEASDLEQIFDFARILSTQPKPGGNKVQIITDGGGFGVLTADYLVHSGLKITRMNKRNLEKLRKITPRHAVLEDVIDLTGDATTEMYREAIDAALDDPNVDMLAVIALFQPPLLTPDIVEVIAEANKRKKKPIIIISAGGKYTEVLKKTLEDSGVPCFSYPQRAAEALGALYNYVKMVGA